MKHSHRAGSPGPRTTPGMTATGIKALRDVPTALQPHRGDPPSHSSSSSHTGLCPSPPRLLHHSLVAPAHPTPTEALFRSVRRPPQASLPQAGFPDAQGLVALCAPAPGFLLSLQLIYICGSVSLTARELLKVKADTALGPQHDQCAVPGHSTPSRRIRHVNDVSVSDRPRRVSGGGGRLLSCVWPRQRRRGVHPSCRGSLPSPRVSGPGGGAWVPSNDRQAGQEGGLTWRWGPPAHLAGLPGPPGSRHPKRQALGIQPR